MWSCRVPIIFPLGRGWLSCFISQIKENFKKYRLPGLIHGPNKTLLVLSSSNEWMSQFLVAWLVPGNHSSANNRAPLNPCSVHVRCLLSCPTSLSQWVTWAEPYTAWKRPTKSEQTFVLQPMYVEWWVWEKARCFCQEGWWMSGKPHSDTQKKIITKKLYLASSAAS